MRAGWRAHALALVALLAPPAFAQNLAAAPADRAVPFEVIVNGSPSGTWLLIERGGTLYAPREAFDEWRLAIAAQAPRIDFRGQEFRALSGIPGFRAKVDLANQSVDLQFSPQAFAMLRMSQELARAPKPDPVMPSAFANYDVSYSRSVLREGPTTGDLGVLGEVGVSTGVGVLTTSVAGRNLLRDADVPLARQWLRLETAFTRDFPDRNLTLRVGDATTRPAMWGREVYFGGVRLGTNFALTPGFVSQPLPAISGLSAAPSTVELYVNDVLRQVSNVPTGPFVIDNFPLLTGGGEARVVVRDLLGRETVLTQRFFSSSAMLAAGLDDWSVEAGRVRRDLGVRSDEYGDRFASGTWRRGVNDRVTLEGRAELSRRTKVLGAGVLTLLPWNVVARAALVGSREAALGRGGYWLAGLEYQDAYASATVEARRASSDFRELGQVDASAIRRQYAGSFSYATQRFGTFGLGFAALERFDGEKVTTVSGNYSIRVGPRGHLAANLSRALQGPTGTAFGVSFLLPLDDNRAASVTANNRDGIHDLYASMLQNPGPDRELGWRVLAGQQQDHRRAEGGLYYQGLRGTLSADASYAPQQQALRVGATGGVVAAAGRVFATRKVEESFALAEVPGYGGVGIGIGGNVLARTDEEGIALVPRLLPYMGNAVRLDPGELPINAEIESIERTVVPSWRSGVRVTFPVRGGRGALLKLVLADGEPAPAGAVVDIPGDNQEFYVARRGEAFVTGLKAQDTVRLRWKGAECRIAVTLPPPKADEIPRVGPLACQGVIR